MAHHVFVRGANAGEQAGNLLRAGPPELGRAKAHEHRVAVLFGGNIAQNGDQPVERGLRLGRGQKTGAGIFRRAAREVELDDFCSARPGDRGARRPPAPRSSAEPANARGRP